MADSIVTLQAQAKRSTLIHESGAYGVCQGLIAKSPILDPLQTEVWVSMRYWTHLNDHHEMEIRKRSKRLHWIEEILVNPCEIWKPYEHRQKRYYLGSFVHYVQPDNEKREVVLVIVNNVELQDRLTVDTMYVLRSSQVDTFRTGRLLWQSQS